MLKCANYRRTAVYIVARTTATVVIPVYLAIAGLVNHSGREQEGVNNLASWLYSHGHRLRCIVNKHVVCIEEAQKRTRCDLDASVPCTTRSRVRLVVEYELWDVQRLHYRLSVIR